MLDSALGDCSFDNEVITIDNAVDNGKLDFESAKVSEGAEDVVSVMPRVPEGPTVVRSFTVGPSWNDVIGPDTVISGEMVVCR